VTTPEEVPAVQATPRALELIARLTARHGPLVFLQSGGCCDGSSPLCTRRGELLIGPHDRLLGRIGDAEFYVDPDLYQRWGQPRFVIDAIADSGDTFSLEGLESMRFVLAVPGEP